MAKKQETFVRINSRVSKAHHNFIKSLAKKLGVSEGEVHRSVIDFYISNKK